MADPDNEDLNLTEEVEANLAIEQGLGVGARELAAQRDPGGVRTADEEPELENGVSVEAGDKDQLDENVSVQGVDDEA
ncbi:MAG: hypothetical protein ACK4MI_09135 [Brevundimonas sp.]|uniref:hypothetical protein n=2 Tax=Pseudomonadota TaxID=1224 RepID=UPI0028D89241|nr:hypothetical protein [uncultured Brevundimonas sp.]